MRWGQQPAEVRTGVGFGLPSSGAQEPPARDRGASWAFGFGADYPVVEEGGYWLDGKGAALYASAVRTDAWKETVKHLDDHFGLYMLVVVCPKCKNERYMRPDQLVVMARQRGLSHLINAKTEIADAMKHMRCHQCGLTGAEWRVERIPRSRDRGFPR